MVQSIRIGANTQDKVVYKEVWMAHLRDWQATAYGCATLRGVDCDASESHIDYREETEWVYMQSLHPYLAWGLLMDSGTSKTKP